MCRLMVALAAVFFVLGWMMPNHNFPWMAFENEAPVFVAVAFLVVGYWVEKNSFFLLPKGAFLFACLATIPIFQFVLGQINYWGDAYVTAIYFGSSAIAYGLGYRIAKLHGTISTYQFLAWVFVFVASLSVWIALRQCLDLPGTGFESPMQSWSRSGANLAQPNQLTSLLLIALISALYLYKCNKISSFPLWIVSAYLGLGIAVAQSRFALLVLVGLLIFISLRAVETNKQNWKKQVFSLFLLVLFEWISWPHIVSVLSDGGLVARQASDSARLIIMSTLLDALLQQPFFGYGWNQIPIAQSSVVIAHPNTVYVSSAHNIVLDILLWNGLLVGGVVLILVGFWLWRRLSVKLNGDAWYGLAIILILLVHSLFEYPLHYAYFLIPLCFFAGSVDTNVPWLKTVALPRGLVVSVFLIGVLAIFSVVTEYPIAQTNLVNAKLLGSKVSQEDRLIDGLGLKGVENLYFLTQFNDLGKLLSMPLYSDEIELKSSAVANVAGRYPIPDVLIRAALLGLASNDCRSTAKYICLIERFHGEKKSRAAMNIVLGKNDQRQYCSVDRLMNYCDFE